MSSKRELRNTINKIYSICEELPKKLNTIPTSFGKDSIINVYENLAVSYPEEYFPNYKNSNKTIQYNGLTAEQWNKKIFNSVSATERGLSYVNTIINPEIIEQNNTFIYLACSSLAVMDHVITRSYKENSDNKELKVLSQYMRDKIKELSAEFMVSSKDLTIDKKKLKNTSGFFNEIHNFSVSVIQSMGEQFENYDSVPNFCEACLEVANNLKLFRSLIADPDTPTKSKIGLQGIILEDIKLFLEEMEANKISIMSDILHFYNRRLPAEEAARKGQYLEAHLDTITSMASQLLLSSQKTSQQFRS